MATNPVDVYTSNGRYHQKRRPCKHELEAHKELAGKLGQVHLVLGVRALPQLQIK